MIEKGDIILFYGKGFFGWIVDKLTKGKYMHCEFMVTHNRSMKVYWRGVTKGKIDASKEGKDFDVWRPYYYSDGRKSKAISYAKKFIKSNSKYGFGNLLAFFFIRCLRKLKIRWFEGNGFVTCSEACVDCCDEAFIIKKLDIPSSLYSPNDIPRGLDGNFV